MDQTLYLLPWEAAPPGDGQREVAQFLSALVVEEYVRASTQHQALCALLFFYREVLARDIGWLEDSGRAKRPQHLPVVVTRQEVKMLLGAIEGVNWIMASLLDGAGLRLLERRRLRAQDIDLGTNGHRDVKTTIIYTHALNRGGQGVYSPMDRV